MWMPTLDEEVLNILLKEKDGRIPGHRLFFKDAYPTSVAISSRCADADYVYAQADFRNGDTAAVISHRMTRDPLNASYLEETFRVSLYPNTCVSLTKVPYVTAEIHKPDCGQRTLTTQPALLSLSEHERKVLIAHLRSLQSLGPGCQRFDQENEAKEFLTNIIDLKVARAAYTFYHALIGSDFMRTERKEGRLEPLAKLTEDIGWIVGIYYADNLAAKLKQSSSDSLRKNGTG